MPSSRVSQKEQANPGSSQKIREIQGGSLKRAYDIPSIMLPKMAPMPNPSPAAAMTDAIGGDCPNRISTMEAKLKTQAKAMRQGMRRG